MIRPYFMLNYTLAISVAGAISIGTNHPTLAQTEAVPRGNMFGIRAVGGAFIPDGDITLRGINSDEASISPIFGLGLHYYPLYHLGIETELTISPVTVGGDTPGSATVLHPRGHIVFHGPWQWSPFAYAGAGAQFVDIAVNTPRSTLYYGGGVRVFLSRHISAHLEARHNLIFEEGFFANAIKPFSQFEILTGIGFSFGGVFANDKDKDGVFLPLDKCPLDPGSKPDGCPDSDGDGLSDNEDLCPKRSGSIKDGCPDQDNDNVTDSRDECPDTPGTLANGWPNPDSDGDNIKDTIDRCPQSPGAPPSGCPNADGDALVDIDDKCPNKPEVVNGYQDMDGCPDQIPKPLKRFTGTIRGIRFTSGRARIRRSSFRILNRAAVILKRYPDIKLHIMGHTDSRGSFRRNTLLSKRRASAVKDFLTGKGISDSRITTEGLGARSPIASNRTRAGRRMNRRIEFRIAQPQQPVDLAE